MKRFLDILIVAVAIVAGAPVLLAIAAAVKLTSRGSVLYWSNRVGRNNCIFSMPKFRTMRTDTPELPTHLLTNSEYWITPLGQVLRSTSLDELPQLWTVLIGQMSLVGPRPSLFNQHDLIRLRSLSGVHRLTPGVTGWAQINGRDELEIEVKVRFDEEYFSLQSSAFDVRIIFLTAFKVLRRDGIQQAGSAAAETAGSQHKAA
jgi:O-antigen biosynthesis protein WbqP